jgi:hypothetical protein
MFNKCLLLILALFGFSNLLLSAGLVSGTVTFTRTTYPVGAWDIFVPGLSVDGGPLSSLTPLPTSEFTDARAVWIYNNTEVNDGLSFDPVGYLENLRDAFLDLGISVTWDSVSGSGGGGGGDGKPVATASQGGSAQVCVSWDPVPGAAGYVVEFGTDETFTANAAQGVLIINPSITSAKGNASGAFYNQATPVYVRVRAFFHVPDVGTVQGEWSDPVTGWPAQIPLETDTDLVLLAPTDLSTTNFWQADVMLYLLEPEFYIGEPIVPNAPIFKGKFVNRQAIFAGIPSGDYWFGVRFFNSNVNSWMFYKGSFTASPGLSTVLMNGTAKREGQFSLPDDVEEVDPATITIYTSEPLAFEDVTFNRLSIFLDGYDHIGLHSSRDHGIRVGADEQTEGLISHRTFPLSSGTHTIRASERVDDGSNHYYVWEPVEITVKSGEAFKVNLGAWQSIKNISTGEVIEMNQDFPSAYISQVDTGRTPLRNNLMRLASLPGDLDGDQLPDSWETSQFGAAGTDPDTDSDGDGATDGDEFFAGTDPHSAADVLQVQSLALGSNLSLTSASKPGKFYRLEKAPPGSRGESLSWQLVYSQAATSSTLDWLDQHANDPKALYRVVVIPN